MADSQKKSANIINAASPSEYARTTVTPLANGGVELSITNATWTNCRYINIPVTANSTYTIKVYIDEYSGTGTFMIPCRQINGDGTVIFTDTIWSTGTKTHTFTADGSTLWLGVYLNNSGTAATATAKIRIMLNEGATALPYEPYSSTGWLHSLRKLTTATEAVENPLYSDGTAITAYTIKGNTVQSGTPTPSNPITISGVGNKTANLFNKNDRDVLTGYEISSSGIIANPDWFVSGYIPVEYGVTYYKNNNSGGRLLLYDSSKTELGDALFYSDNTYTVSNNNVKYIRINNYIGAINTYMLNDISASELYEPWGYKIPISKDSQPLTPMYLTEPLLKIGDYEDTLNSNGTVTRRIGKIDLGTRTYTKTSSGNFYFSSALSNVRIITNNQIGNGLCTNFFEVAPQVYASTPYSFCTCINSSAVACFNGTGFEGYTTEQFQEAMSGVYMYYVLATPTTETVTAPSIPTTDGANTITVDTTVQPSEFTATWTGWHDASVQEWDGSQWQ